MALTKCPECTHDVSTEADACPNCGYPIKRDRPAEQDFRTWMGNQNRVGFVMSILGAIAGLILLPFFLLPGVALLLVGGVAIVLHLAVGTHKRL